MAGAKVPAPLDPMVNGDDWTNILARLERTYKGYDGVSLTNWAVGNTTRPKIAAGSVIEIDGSPFYYATDETIVDEAGLTDGWCYIKHVVSGDAVTPTLTNTFGTWDTAKQGFYDGTDRYSLFAMYRSGAITKIFTQKSIVSNNGILIQTPLQTDINAPAHIDYTSTYLAGEKEKTLVLRTAGNGTERLSFAHGLGDVLTNRRIISVSHIYWGPTPSIYGVDPDYSYWYVQGSDIYLRFSAATPTSYTYQIVVKYI